MSHKVAPSVLSADFANLQRDVEMINNSAADWFHVDIMDGHFVPNISFGFPVVKAIKKWATKPLDVHLMITDPDRYLKDFKDAGADHITVHLEACVHLHRTIQAIKALGCLAGVAINPHTPVALLADIVADIDLVIIMSVNPGFGGQAFIEHTYKKVAELKALADEYNPDMIIEIDGGVTLDNAAKLVAAGATSLIAGNFVFNAEDQVGTIAALKKVTG
ncbi:ribulose-phosphate 3-epimerase [Mucilaginibacter myungsuensis]|uniref:Ribulose-phosphate 3-epimerase n=1 Tax=Mucilaginibacter myungsuensis TaxID=649104 RepID=A0A929PZK0_9SPHI|nr:ribulose-phosphate 3-epimerase [Mucilaginibacter myungsuensis]MBE9664580.1 ribulose-phosphate 3-epimerase [Mucilaginibacter myungsuensis]MDN3601070.1 ribulose-phosphate 3-epimerase [Mucilaginibacter myungsuensis]